ncbi:MAG: CoA ester lyase [Azospirillaceae bacterium]
MPSTLTAVATALLVPGDRPERFAKARERCRHAVIIDLEDAVPVAGKAAAREHVAAYLSALGGERAADEPLLGVRLNALTEREAVDDLALLRGLAHAPDFVALPKAESGRDVAILRAALGARTPVLAIVETVAGLDAAKDVTRALAGNGALGFGAADYCAETGMAMKSAPLLPARARIVEAATAGRVPALDVPWLGIGDLDGLVAECREVRDLGFSGKLAIHPEQVEPIIAAFRPSAAEVAAAEKVVAAFEAAAGKTIQVGGRMIDKPLYDSALAVLSRRDA